MAEKDSINPDARAREEDYFRKKDRELIEKMRQAAAADRTRRDLAAKTGLQDPALIAELEALGFTPDTIGLLPLVPILQVAWAEGGVSDAERKLLVDLARARGIDAGSAADGQLAAWMERRPAADVFAKATRLIRAMLDNTGGERGDLRAEDVIKYAESIAAASGGLFGLGRISAEERAALAQIEAALRKR
jgi:hypothetical protein